MAAMCGWGCATWITSSPPLARVVDWLVGCLKERRYARVTLTPHQHMRIALADKGAGRVKLVARYDYKADDTKYRGILCE